MGVQSPRPGKAESTWHFLFQGLHGPAVVVALAATLVPAAAVADEGCPTKGGTLTFARTADVSGWYYQDNNPTIWAWPLVSLALVRNKVDASGLEGAAAESWEA